MQPSAVLQPWQIRYLEDQARFKLLCASVQTGKSHVTTLDHCLRRAEKPGLSVMLSAGERQAKELIAEKCAMHLRGFDAVIDSGYFSDEGGSTSIVQHEVKLPNRARLIALPANPRTARGYTGDVLLDEFSQHLDDRAIWAALFTRITRGHRLDVASTIWGTENKFYELCEMLGLHTGTVPPRQPVKHGPWSGHLVPMTLAVQEGLAVDIEELRKGLNDDEVFQQEYLCIPMRGGDQYITLDLVKRCETPDATQQFDYRPRPRLYAGWDIARSRDLSVIWIIEVIDDVVLKLRDGVEIIKPRMLTRGVITMRNVPYPDQEDEARRVAECVERFAIDQGVGGGVICEHLMAQFPGVIEPVAFTVQSKERLAGEGKAAMEEQRLLVPVDDVPIRASFTSLKRFAGSGGHMRIDAAHTRYGHADHAWAAWLAVSAASSGAYIPASEGGLVGETVMGNLMEATF